MSENTAKNATSGPEVEKTESLEQIDGGKVLDAVEASEASAEPVADPAADLSADIAKRVSYWATEIQTISLPRRLFSSRRLYKDGVEIKGFKADLKMVYAFLLMLNDIAKVYAEEKGQKDVAFTLAVPVSVIHDSFGLTEATTQRYLAMLGDGQSKKTGETFFGLVTWKKDCKGFHIVKIYDLRYEDVGGFELK
jgi:hypothetical protein